MSEHHKTKKWSSYAKKARSILKAQLPLPCVECGAPVYPTDNWDVGHLFPLSQGGDVKQYGAAHRTCNRSSGGKLGAQTTHAKRKNQRQW